MRDFQIFTGIFQIAAVYLMAIMTPGPSTSLIIRNGIVFSRTLSILASLGIIVGVAIQSAIVLIGVSIFVKDSFIFHLLKTFGSMYLIYLGYKSLKGYDIVNNQVYSNTAHKKKTIFMEGLLLEILNPIAFIFFVSIFVNLISEQCTLKMKFLYWLEILIIGGLWFGGLSFLSSSSFISRSMKAFKRKIEITLGIAFIVFGLKSLIF